MSEKFKTTHLTLLNEKSATELTTLRSQKIYLVPCPPRTGIQEKWMRAWIPDSVSELVWKDGDNRCTHGVFIELGAPPVLTNYPASYYLDYLCEMNSLDKDLVGNFAYKIGFTSKLEHVYRDLESAQRWQLELIPQILKFKIVSLMMGARSFRSDKSFHKFKEFLGKVSAVNGNTFLMFSEKTHHMSGLTNVNPESLVDLSNKKLAAVYEDSDEVA